MGVIVLVVAVLPLLGVGGRQMFKAETPTPMKDQKLTPRMAETAKGLWVVYILLHRGLHPGASGASACRWFDAVVHAFSVMGLGGFSSHDASLGYFDSVAIEIAVAVFALIAGINFATHFAVLRGRAGCLRARSRGSLVSSASCLWSAASCWPYALAAGFLSRFAHGLRYSLFNTISVATTLGFATTDYGQWPFFAGCGCCSCAVFPPVPARPAAASR
jgi:trk system potassium uptake protein